MTGPIVGSVTYSQGPDGSLVLMLTIDFAQPNTTYEPALVCGSSHAVACGFLSLGTLITDAVGAGSTTVTVPLSDLQSPSFGPGYRNDHIDIAETGGGKGSSLTAGAINYFVCPSREGLPQYERAEFGARRSDQGDPRGPRTPEGDPHAGGGIDQPTS